MEINNHHTLETYLPVQNTDFLRKKNKKTVWKDSTACSAAQTQWPDSPHLGAGRAWSEVEQAQWFLEALWRTDREQEL